MVKLRNQRRSSPLLSLCLRTVSQSALHEIHRTLNTRNKKSELPLKAAISPLTCEVGGRANSKFTRESSRSDNSPSDGPVSQPRVEPRSLETAELHLELNRVCSIEADDSTIRAEFRKVVQRFTNAVGVGHVVRDSDGNWDLKPHHATGRVPRRQDFVDRFAKCCSVTIERNTIQIESFLGLESFYTPIQVYGADEVLIVLTNEGDSSSTLFVLEIVSAYFGLWFKGRRTKRNDWKLTSLAALIELVSDIENQPTTSLACQVTANELARHLNCHQVAVATKFGGRLRLSAVSGSSKARASSQTSRRIKTALSETLLRNEVSSWPAKDRESLLLLGHQQFVAETKSEAVLSIPLRTASGVCVGALLLSGDAEFIQGDRLPNFVRAAAPRIASAIEVVRRAQQSWLRRWLSWCWDLVASNKGMLALLAFATICGLLFLPVPYRVRTSCVVESTQRRFVVAPYDGVIENGFVDPGAEVRTGQLLARMDDQQLRYEMASVTAELAQARKKREIELADRNVASTILSELEYQRLMARKKLLEHQQEQVEIRSPVNGVVLSGSMERSQGISVDLGKVLYEVGPLDELKVEVLIPAEEISQVEVGSNTRVWIKGLETESFIGTLKRIHPRSELRDSKNVFVADIEIDNAGGVLRPGMQGSVRIDCNPKALGWNLFHKPWEYLVSRLTWW